MIIVINRGYRSLSRDCIFLRRPRYAAATKAHGTRKVWPDAAARTDVQALWLVAGSLSPLADPPLRYHYCGHISKERMAYSLHEKWEDLETASRRITMSGWTASSRKGQETLLQSRNWRASATKSSRLCTIHAPRGLDSSSLLLQHVLQPMVTFDSSFALPRPCQIRDIARQNTAQCFLSSQSTALVPVRK